MKPKISITPLMLFAMLIFNIGPCLGQPPQSKSLAYDFAQKGIPKEASTPIGESIEIPRTTTLALKTNLLAYSLLVANIGIEIPLGSHVSLDIPIYYSPYTLIESYKFRVLMTQPELRYWLNKPMKGHFIGLHALGGWYNVAYNKHNRYQDKQGAAPAWGSGVSYGYSLDLGRSWGIEFTAGIGYIRLNYDLFYNIENGAKFDSQSKSYWGPSKSGVNLVYKFNK